ncbi:MAG: hypothetical protein NTW19_21475 [Planctomycetota bacterium]|nr:hypothetical protein [Planctomycetota bacterium]
MADTCPLAGDCSSRTSAVSKAGLVSRWTWALESAVNCWPR